MKKSLMTLSMICFLGAAFGGCTSIKVRPLSPEIPVKHVCIQDNPKVIVGDFLSVVQNGLRRHDISSEVFSNEKPANCEDVLTYTALRSWDFAPYVTHAELNLYRGGEEIASGVYHLRGKGGFSLKKWQGTQTKMDPVIDKMFKDYK